MEENFVTEKFAQAWNWEGSLFGHTIRYLHKKRCFDDTIGHTIRYLLGCIRNLKETLFKVSSQGN